MVKLDVLQLVLPREEQRIDGEDEELFVVFHQLLLGSLFGLEELVLQLPLLLAQLAVHVLLYQELRVILVVLVILFSLRVSVL